MIRERPRLTQAQPVEVEPSSSVPAYLPVPPRTTIVTVASPTPSASRPRRRQRLVAAALLALAALFNVDHLGNLWNKLAAPNDGLHEQLASDGALPGVLFVRSVPANARVFINGNYVGTTPFAQGFSQRGGAVELRVERKGHQPFQQIVSLLPQGVHVIARLKKARGSSAPPPRLMLLAKAEADHRH